MWWRVLHSGVELANREWARFRPPRTNMRKEEHRTIIVQRSTCLVVLCDLNRALRQHVKILSVRALLANVGVGLVVHRRHGRCDLLGELLAQIFEHGDLPNDIVGLTNGGRLLYFPVVRVVGVGRRDSLRMKCKDETEAGSECPCQCYSPDCHELLSCQLPHPQAVRSGHHGCVARLYGQKRRLAEPGGGCQRRQHLGRLVEILVARGEWEGESSRRSKSSPKLV